MIAWMQKHNKYLVVTIWIATIAFIGAGFVGWGTYHYGSKAGAVAKVGEVTISQEKYNFTYQNLYRQVGAALGGKFDDAKAKKMQLPRQAFNRLVVQAYLLNLAREYGVIISDEELADAIASLPAFQDQGRFSKKIYETFLESRGLNARTFEAIFRDDLTVEKLMKLINKGAVPYERSVIAGALSLSDKIRYRVLIPADVNVTIDETALKSYWEKHKDQYKTPRLFKLAVLWTDTADINASEEALKNFYHKNSFNYTDAQGKELSYEQARKLVLRDYRIKKGKKRALLDYIALKKGKKMPTEVREFAEGDPTFSKALWQEIVTHSPGSLVKPKPVGARYATVRIDKVIEPRIMSFDAAKSRVALAWTAAERKAALKAKAEALLKGPAALTKESGEVSLSSAEALSPLNLPESLQFLQKLFTSNNKKGIIFVNGKIVVYEIVDQKFGKGDGELSAKIGATADRIKKDEFEQNLLKALSKRYPVKKFVKGI
ncbi:peptidylprolyl isomerase [Nitratifractor sp.]|uniref:peptidylprolyl isomerase n=1 Tax=Nitratifractor sp. TaxID=2268144 RepID=UPI0025CC110D|nr:peptidylprolyl isomerase [Nitratifractor sp.]